MKNVCLGIILFYAICVAELHDTCSVPEVTFDSTKIEKTIHLAKQFKVSLVSDFKKLRLFYNQTKAVVAELEKANKKQYEFSSVSKQGGFHIVEYCEAKIDNASVNDSIVTLTSDARIQIFVDNDTMLIFKILWGG